MDRKERIQDLECPLIQYSQENEFQSKEKCSDIMVEVKKQLELAGPLIMVNLLIYSLQVISVMFVGHLGELALSGASMATSFASVTGFSLLGAMLVLLLVTFPLACIWANAGCILKFLGQDPEISSEAGFYARHMIPSIFAYALLQCHVRFLQSQNNVFPMMLSAGITTLLHVLTCWFLVFKSGLGSKGAALANAVSYWINLLFLAIYVRVSQSCKKTWKGFSKESLRDLPKFLKLAVPSAVMIRLEIWSFEMMVLVSGLLPNPKLETSVLSITLNTSSMAYMIPIGLGSAVSIRVSNKLGAGRPYAARLAARIALLMVSMEGILAAIIMILGRNIWGYCYSSEEKVVKYVRQMLLFIAGSHFLDGIQSVLSGGARGCGWQKIGAMVNLAAYYLLGLPIGILAFVYHMGGKAKKATERVHCMPLPKEAS